ncbi:hypothetical protein IJ098_03440 [Candidatus Saccharibacteria bacterium]|nr:hypothetical protein [Candidatus Saccharibacteria bacterium]
MIENQKKRNDKLAEAGRREKEAYLARKMKMLPLERRNYSKITFFRATGGFYVAGGHSAIILYNKIAPELGLKARLKRDRDFGARFDEGVISVKNPNFYKNKLLESVYIREVVEGKDSFSFLLKKAMPKEEFSLLMEMENIKREKLLNLVSSSSAMPKLYTMLRDVVKLTYSLARKNTEPIASDIYIKKLVNATRDALEWFLIGARKEANIVTALDKAERSLFSALRQLIIIESAGIVHIEDCSRVGMAISNAMTQLTVERKNKERQENG